MNTYINNLIRAGAFLGLLAMSISAQASNFIGNVCFSLDVEDEEEDTVIVLGISEIGAGHFMAQGYTYNSLADPAEERTLLRGNLELFGETISMSLNGSYAAEGQMLDITAHVHLSAFTLSGPVSIIGTYYDPDIEESGVATQNGTLTPTACAES